MLKIEDVEIYFKSMIDISYKDELERLFFFNGNQHRYEAIVEQSLDDYGNPTLLEYCEQVGIVFDRRDTGQTLHIMDSDRPGAELIGVVMYARDSINTITIVHMVLQEECKLILRSSRVNIALIILERLISIFEKLKGVERVKIYYTGKILRINGRM